MVNNPGVMTTNNRNGIGKMLKRRRGKLRLSRPDLAAKAGVSASHIGRIERAERFPSALTLWKLARPLDFLVVELYIHAGYLSPKDCAPESGTGAGTAGLDPYVAKVLSREPVEMQCKVVAILSALKPICPIGLDTRPCQKCYFRLDGKCNFDAILREWKATSRKG